MAEEAEENTAAEEEEEEEEHDDSAWDIGHEDNCPSMETHKASL